LGRRRKDFLSRNIGGILKQQTDYLAIIARNRATHELIANGHVLVYRKDHEKCY